MGRKSKRTSAPAPMEIPPPQPPPIPPYAHGTWFPTPPMQSPWWRDGHQQLGLTGSSTQGSLRVSPASTYSWPVAENDDDFEVQAWGPNFYPPGGFTNFMNSTTSPTGLVSNGSKPQAIDIVDDDNVGKCDRTEKRMLWTKPEDLKLVSAWLKSSNDPIQSNYRKNDQYWKSVADFYNSIVPKNRAREVKQIKDHFLRIKKRVTWFCDSRKEANALWASWKEANASYLACFLWSCWIKQ